MSGTTVDCGYWKGLFASLPDAGRCAYATHVINSNLEELNQVLACVSRESIVDCAIRAYQEWHAQPECDKVLKRFDPELVRQRYLALDALSENCTYGVLSCLEEMNSVVAAELARTLSSSSQSERVRLVISELTSAG